MKLATLAAFTVTLLLAGGCLAAEPPAPDVTPAEARGTWLTTTANTALASPQDTAQTMRRLRELGLNAAYIECWKNGYTEFPSDKMNDLVGVSMKINDAPAELQRDLLQESIIEAHRNGLLAIGWFEYGFMAAYKDTDNELRRVAGEKGWLTQTRDGNVVGEQNPFVWMNPLHPGPQQLLIDLTLEAVDRYDLDGVQLDDRIAMPVEMGYDDYTKQLYASEHDGQMPPNDPRDPAWVQWRADKVTDYAKRFATALKERRPNLIVSVSPAPHPWSLDNYACDWPKWMDWTTGDGQPLWDEYLPQCYRMDGDATIRSIDEQIQQVNTLGDGRIGVLMPGVRLVGDGPDMPEGDLQRVVEHARDTKIGGVVLWFSRGVLEVMPDAVAEAFEQPARHPLRPADWRPMPIVAERSGGRWTVDVEQAGPYRVIALLDGQWRVVERRTFDAGEATVRVNAAKAVELLVDRRDATLTRKAASLH